MSSQLYDVRLACFNGFGYAVARSLSYGQARKKLTQVAKQRRNEGMDVRSLPTNSYELMWPGGGCSDLEGVLYIQEGERFET